MYDTVLVVGFDKPKDRGVSGPSVAVTGVRDLPATPAGWFSLCAAPYFETYGAGREDLGRIAVKNHHNGTLAPKSMLKREITIDDVLRGAHHLLAVRPLRLRRAVRRRGGGDHHARRARARASATTRPRAASPASRWPEPAEGSRASTSSRWKATEMAAKQVYAQAGITDPRKEIHVAQVHDCFTLTELLAYEDLGFCEKGSAKEHIARRHVRARRRAAREHRRRPQDASAIRPARPACA